MAETKKSSKTTSKNTQHKTYARLYRSSNNRVLAGVAGGLAEYFHFDPTLIRIIFLLLTIFGGSGVVIYIVLWIVMPIDTSSVEDGDKVIKQNVEEMKDRAKGAVESFRVPDDGSHGHLWAALLVVVGVIFLVNNYGFLDLSILKLWPVLLIIAGLILLRRR